MVDPSLLFSEEGVAWIEDDEATRDNIVVPATFVELLSGRRDFEPASLVAPDDLEAFGQRRDQLVAILLNVATFSYQEARLSPQAQAVQVALLDSQDPVAVLRADEWAFIQSQSFMISKLRQPLDAFRDAGSVIVEYGHKIGQQIVRQVIPTEHIPPVLIWTLKAKVTVKWIVVGGLAAGGGTLGGVVGTAIGGPLGTLAGGAAGATAAEKLGSAAVLAIDP